MNAALLLLAVLTTLGLLLAVLDFALGARRIRALADVTPAQELPTLSIVVAARDEARGIEEALGSLLALDYPGVEIVVVDDRSTDGTGAILQEMAKKHGRLRVRHIHELPGGWLGKNHALFVGAAEASGEFLLFTDADVVFEPSTVRRAMTIVQQESVDHLAVLPDVQVPGTALKIFVASFGVFFSLYSRPWKASDPRSPFHIGVGAFNLIRTSAYRAIGTHRAIAMRPDDDLKLGKLVKKHRFRQQVAGGHGFVVVEWYRSLSEAIDGLMKNAFAGVNYSLLAVAGSTLGLLVMYVWPFIGVAVTSGATQVLNGVSVVLIVTVYWITERRAPALYVFGFPFAAILFAYIIWRSALIAVTSGRVTWRGTSYPLSELRANRV